MVVSSQKKKGSQSILSLLCGIVLCCTLCLPGCIEYTTAYIPDEYLANGWYEDIVLRNTGTQVFGLDQWTEVTYRNQGAYPAWISVTTLKTLVLQDEQQLIELINTSIHDMLLHESMTLNASSRTQGNRMLTNEHTSLYITYHGSQEHHNTTRLFRVIGEIWNCGYSGTSILCYGFAYSTQENSTEMSLDAWHQIIQNKEGSIEQASGMDGLLDHVQCH